MALTKMDRRVRIKKRVRKIVKGSADRPRMSVFRSNKEIYVQFIDDATGVTLLAVSSAEADIAKVKGSKVEKAALVGKTAAERAKNAGIDTVSFDRNGYLYHGRIKSLAEGARGAGLNF